LRGRIRSPASAVAGLRSTLPCGGFLAFGEVRKFLREFVNFFLCLLVLLTTGRLTTLDVFVLVLAGIELQSEKIGKILCAAAATAASATTSAAALLHLNLRI
jgi:hypothetical protein